jgi:NADH dehydrogenase
VTTDLVTGAFSNSGSRIAAALLDAGRHVRTLTFHPERDHPLRGEVEAYRYVFDDPVALAATLEDVDTLYNTFWVRFDHGPATFANAIEGSRALFGAARRAGVRRIVHVSITNPSLTSSLPYFRGKALVEQALAGCGVSFASVRPTWLFGGEPDVLVNNIAWILRRTPVFPLPGGGGYRVQPVHVDDLASICLEAARTDDDLVCDAAGPETWRFSELVGHVGRAVGARAVTVPVPAPVMRLASIGLGRLLGDVVLTGDEITGLMDGLLVSGQPPLGEVVFTEWLNGRGDELGRRYANELRRHFTPARTAAV